MTRMAPRRWTPPQPTPRATQKRSSPPLPPVRRIELSAPGPEDLVLRNGRIITGVSDGSVLSIDPDDGSISTVVNTGVRPLGLNANSDGSLLICDHDRGLLRLPHDGGELEVLVDTIDGERLTFASNVVQADDGTIYFSASSRRWTLEHYTADLLEHSGTGRLLRRAPTGKVDTLLDGLHFANGVVLSPDNSCVVVAESGAFRVTRYWLTGRKAGTHDVLIENLPGFPDNMSLGSDELVWITIASPRHSLMDRLLPLPGVLRKLVWALPERFKPAAAHTTWVIAFDFTGRVVHDLQNDDDTYCMVTGVVEDNETLYLGSLTEHAIAISHVPA